MIATVLIDNLASEPLTGEWGLSIHIEWNGKNVLLDAGTSGAFASNADLLGIPLDKVDFAVLSHAHFDHANGLRTFFERNEGAKVYLRGEAKENCYGVKEGVFRYNGIERGTLRAFSDRFVRVEGVYSPCEGAYLLPHSTPGLKKIARHDELYRRRGPFFLPDSFDHEQTLVLEGENGLAVFSSCSHAGADNILREVERAFPDRPIAAMVGGFHLFRSSEKEVEAFADRVAATGIKRLVTGHCTGDAAYAILKARLGDRIDRLETGLVIGI